jgi:hypothetical protein
LYGVEAWESEEQWMTGENRDEREVSIEETKTAGEKQR